MALRPLVCANRSNDPAESLDSVDAVPTTESNCRFGIRFGMAV
jgi:hypothetical protein